MSQASLARVQSLVLVLRKTIIFSLHWSWTPTCIDLGRQRGRNSNTGRPLVQIYIYQNTNIFECFSRFHVKGLRIYIWFIQSLIFLYFSRSGRNPSRFSKCGEMTPGHCDRENFFPVQEFAVALLSIASLTMEFHQIGKRLPEFYSTYLTQIYQKINNFWIPNSISLKYIFLHT